MWKTIYAWLDERIGLNDLYTNMLDRPEPKTTWWNTLGSASMFLFILQGLTGIFLTVYYTPSPDHAYDSINYIMEGVAFGWLIRGIHHWGATLMVVLVPRSDRTHPPAARDRRGATRRGDRARRP